MKQPTWTKYFDRIFLVNLKYRKDRLKSSVETLKMFDIPFERYEAIANEDGRLGLYQTMMELFNYSRNKGYKKIVVFEDDIRFLEDPNPVMDECVLQLPGSWDLIYLGANNTVPFKSKFSDNLLPVTRSYSTHAVCYNSFAMKSILSQPMVLPYDELLVKGIQPHGQSFCTYPMLVSQSGGYSDIEKKVVNHYPMLLENRFIEQTKNL